MKHILCFPAYHGFSNSVTIIIVLFRDWPWRCNRSTLTAASTHRYLWPYPSPTTPATQNSTPSLTHSSLSLWNTRSSVLKKCTIFLPSLQKSSVRRKDEDFMKSHPFWLSVILTFIADNAVLSVYWLKCLDITFICTVNAVVLSWIFGQMLVTECYCWCWHSNSGGGQWSHCVHRKHEWK